MLLGKTQCILGSSSRGFWCWNSSDSHKNLTFLTGSRASWMRINRIISAWCSRGRGADSSARPVLRRGHCVEVVPTLGREGDLVPDVGQILQVWSQGEHKQKVCSQNKENKTLQSCIIIITVIMINIIMSCLTGGRGLWELSTKIQHEVYESAHRTSFSRSQ